MAKLFSKLPRQSTWVCKRCAITRRQYSEFAKGEHPKYQLPSTPIRTRFAPSPTGYLHLGSLRTALYNYLAARQTGGQFIIRIEDTDKRRTVADAEKRLLQDLKWAGLEWDEGPDVGGKYGPYRQSERNHIYRDNCDQLLRNGHAYRCFCSPERLKAVAELRLNNGLGTEYDGTCEAVSLEESNERAAKGESYVVRLNMQRVIEHTADLVHRRSKPQLQRVKPHTSKTGSKDSPILLKSDGSPTYHLANVVDDHLMKITHVIRGQEWLSSTPKHLYLFEAFGWAPPLYAHVGLLQDENGEKLSKRKGDISISRYKDELDILPVALLNFLALMGWSHRSQNDKMALKDLIENFSWKFSKGNANVAMGKLWYLQKRHVQDAVVADGPEKAELVKRVLSTIQNTFPEPELLHPKLQDPHARLKYVEMVLENEAAKFTTAAEFINRLEFYFTPEFGSADSPPSLQSGQESLDHKARILQRTIASLEALDETSWRAKEISDILNEILTAESSLIHTEGSSVSVSAKQLQTYVHAVLRYALTGGKPCTSTSIVMSILGRDVTLDRLRKGLVP